MKTRIIFLLLTAIMCNPAICQSQSDDGETNPYKIGTPSKVGFKISVYDKQDSLIDVEYEPNLFAQFSCDDSLNPTVINYGEYNANGKYVRGKIWKIQSDDYSYVDSTATIKIVTEDNKVWDIIFYYNQTRVDFIFANHRVTYTGEVKY